MNKKALIEKIYKGNKISFIILLFCSIAESLTLIGVSIMLERILSVATEKNFDAWIKELIISIILLIVAILVYLFSMYFKPKYKKKAMNQYKNNIYQLILQKNIASFNKYESSTYISSLTNDVGYIEENYIFSIFTMITQILLFVASIVVMILYSPVLTIFAVILALLPFVCALLVGSKLSTIEKTISDSNASFMHFVKDNLVGFSTIKVFKAEKEMSKLFNCNNNKLESDKATKTKVEVQVEFIQTLTSLIAQLGVFFIGAYLCIKTNKIEPATIILFVQLMNFVMQPLILVPSLISKRAACKPLFEKICNLLKEEESNDQGLEIVNDNIIIKNLAFSYEDNEILKEINLKLEKGKSYAIVGPSGSGKTTLINLLVGRNLNYNGLINYGNIELKEASIDLLYNIISIIEQNVFVFDDTIVNNITMYSEVDSNLLEEVIIKSGLGRLIKEKGLDYKCGENGCNLSGGEKQRIAIARGLLKNSKIMFLDEITSALDNETSNEILHNILDIEDITKVMITHKLDEGILNRFDEIIVLKNGNIVEQGNYKDLMDQKGLLNSLVKLN